MTNEELNIALYEKMCDEQKRFKAELMEKTPAWILDGAYEYCIREDIVLCMETLDLSDKQAKALLKLENPLAKIYEAWGHSETRHMEHIRDTIMCKANAEIRADFIRAKREER